jgi:hypothetical protein
MILTYKNEGFGYGYKRRQNSDVEMVSRVG